MSSEPSQRPKFIFKARGHSLELGRQTRIMGIINVTNDSFSRDGLLNKSAKAIVSQARRMVDEGADILDIGGESSRPGARKISVKEECRRIIPAVKSLSGSLNVPISVDTYKPQVARAALEAGASIINDIYGATIDRTLAKAVKDYDAGIILMHMKGTPQNMQRRPHYRDCIAEITARLGKSLEICLECGIKSDRIMIDPGIGFGKTLEHNLMIIRNLERFNKLKKPILIGTSRKSFIGKSIGKEVGERLMGTAASVCASIRNGAHMVRVHEVGPMRDVARLSDAIFYGI